MTVRIDLTANEIEVLRRFLPARNANTAAAWEVIDRADKKIEAHRAAVRFLASIASLPFEEQYEALQARMEIDPSIIMTGPLSRWCANNGSLLARYTLARG